MHPEELQELLMLELRSAISDKEFQTASANNDLAKNGRWTCDWYCGMCEADKKVQELLTKLKAS